MLKEIEQSKGFYMVRAHEAVTNYTYWKRICHVVIISMVEPESVEK